jgi:hypothetical protein
MIGDIGNSIDNVSNMLGFPLLEGKNPYFSVPNQHQNSIENCE